MDQSQLEDELEQLLEESEPNEPEEESNDETLLEQSAEERWPSSSTADRYAA